MANPYNFSIPDSSPTFIYYPTREGGDLKSGWRSFYSNSPDSAFDSTNPTENKASGISSHSTSMQGASLEINFLGTAIWIYGSGSAGAYTTRLNDRDPVDGQPSPSNGLLASYSGLDYKAHTFSLNVTQAQSLNITSATMEVGVGKQGASVKDRTIPAVSVNSDGSSVLNTAYFQTSGGGSFNTYHDTQEYPRADTNSAGSGFIFRFDSASALQVIGSVNNDHGRYSVSLSPPGGVSSTTRTFDAASKWFAYNNTIYWESGLDRTKSYTLTLTNLDDNKYLDINSVRLLDGQGPGPDGSSGLGTGAIVGIAVGVVALLVIVVAMLAFFWRRHRRHGSEYDGPTPATWSGAHNMVPIPSQTQPLLEAHVEPFLLPPNFTPYIDSSIDTTKKSHTKGGSGSTFNTSSIPPTGSVMSSTNQFGYHSTPWSEAGSSSQSTSNSQNAPSSKGPAPSTPTRIVRQETDAGPVPAQPPSPQEEVLPPGYNPAWSSGQTS
ncbi:hypothetical protein L218DRAFT_1073523 [Marasmius fiardii PR-910]|nr:hypothetical protein L218DRAFT_1073523 [Marasmius fiardii PR-910]